jgi:hypothetical protein
VPWVEIKDRQSNFDESTGKFVVASPDAVIDGIKVGRYLQTYSRRDFGPRLGFAYDVRGNGKTVVRGGYGIFWNFSPGGTSSSKAQNPPFLQSTDLRSTFGTDLTLATGMPAPPGVDPNRAPSGTTRSIFDVNFRDAYSHNFNVNVQQQFGDKYMIEVAYAGSRARQMAMKGDPNQARPVVGITNQNINRPYFGVSPGLTTLGQLQSKGFLDYNALLLKFQRRFANRVSVLSAYTLGRAIDLNSDNDGTVTLTNVYDREYNRGPADYDVRHTFSTTFTYQFPWAVDRLYGGWELAGLVYLRSGLPFTVTQTQSVLSTGTGNRPNQVCSGVLSNPTIDQWFDTSCFVPPADTTGTYGNTGRNTMRGPGQVNMDSSLIKNTKLGRFDTELRVEAFNIFNHPQFAQPNGSIGNSSVGRITSMLASSSCAFCGTTERQVQLAMKVKF